MNSSYPEIVALQHFVAEHQVRVSKIQDSIHKDLTPISLTFLNEEMVIQVMDEYNDLAKDNSLLTAVLCLRELELIEESGDFDTWCRFQSIEGNPRLKEYFAEIVRALPTIKVHFPNEELDSFVSDLDFQLNSGAAQALRQ